MRRSDFAVLTIAIALFCSATLPWIANLGMEYDEAHFLPYAAKISNGAEEHIELPWGVTIADRPIPIMTMPYLGVLDAFVYAAPYRFFGTSVVVSRCTNIALAIGVLVLAWWIARRESGAIAGAAALAFMLADVEWVLHAPTNFGPFLLEQVFALIAIAALQQWWESQRARWFFLAVAVLALAFHEKLTFIWVLSSLSIAILLFEAKRTWQSSRWWYYPAGLLLAIVIASPILYSAYAVPELILGYSKANTKAPPDWAVLISARWKMFDQMMRGNWTMELTTGPVPGAFKRGPALMLLFFAGLAASIYARQRMSLILYTTSFGIWLWNLAFPDAGRIHHYLLMTPLWQIGAAAALAKLARPLQYATLALMLWAAFDATRAYTLYTAQVQRTGGINYWSDMTIRAMEWFEANPRLEPVTTSWGIARPFVALSGGRLRPVEHFFDTMADPLPPQTQSELNLLIGKERQVWLVSNVMTISGQQWQRVVNLASAAHKQPIHLNTFPSRDKKTQIDAYTFTPMPPSPANWAPVSKNEFPASAFRLRLEGRADSDTESITVLWLDASGAVVMSDSRGFHWFPHIHPATTLEFGPNYWPAGFGRQILSNSAPVRVRVTSTLSQARITSIEVPAQ